MPAAKWTAEQKTEALNLYREDGLAAAAKATHIPAGTIASWAHRAGLQSMHPEAMRAATEERKAQADAKRTELASRLLEQAAVIAERLDAPYQEFMSSGFDIKPVWYERPPLQVVRHGATAVETLIKTVRLEQGETTSNQGVTVSEGFSLDAELESFIRGAAAAAGSTGSVAEHSPNGTASAG